MRGATTTLSRALAGGSAYGPCPGAGVVVTGSGDVGFLIAEMGVPTDALPLPDAVRRRLRRSVVLAGMGRDASTGTVEFDGRELRTATDRSLDPRHSCRGCRATYVLVSTSTLSERSAAIEVIGAALHAKCRGLDHRRIATRLGLSAATVAGACGASLAAEEVRAVATAWVYRLDSSLGRITARAAPFDDALEALGVALYAVIRALGPARSPWPSRRR